MKPGHATLTVEVYAATHEQAVEAAQHLSGLVTDSHKMLAEHSADPTVTPDTYTINTGVRSRPTCPVCNGPPCDAALHS